MADVEVRDVLLRCSGRTLHRSGFLCAMGSGRGYVEVKEAFTRADPSTCATFIDRDVGAGQVLRLAEAGKVRTEYPPGLSGLVDQFGYPYCGPSLEGSRTNLLLRSQELDDAAWTKGNTSVTANALTAPDGTVTADKLVENGATGTHDLKQGGLTITANGNVSYTHFAVAGERTIIRLFILDTAETNGCRAEFNLSTGVASSGTGFGTGAFSLAAIEKVSGGYRCKLMGSIGGGLTTAKAMARLCQSAGVDNYTGDTVSGAYFWGAQFENAAFPSSYLKTVASAVTRAADAITLQLNTALQALTIHCDFLHPSSDAGVRGVFHLGAAGVVSRLFDLNWSGTKYRVTHGDAATGYVEASAVATPSPGDRVRIAACLYADGHVSIEQAINFGATAGTVANATTKAFTAITQQVLVGRRDVGFETYGPMLESKLIRNARTLAEVEAVP